MNIYGFEVSRNKHIVQYQLKRTHLGLEWLCIGIAIHPDSIRNLSAFVRTLNGFILTDLQCTDLTKLTPCHLFEIEK